MNVLCAPDKFRGTMTAAQAAAAMARGVRRAGHQADTCPIADGGEGTLEVVLAVAAADILENRVTGPLGSPVAARWAILRSGVAIVELAQASGLQKVPANARDPTRNTTFGTGELVLRAIERGCAEVILFVGGSATIDGGAGAAQALGAKLFDHEGAILGSPTTGGNLVRIARVEPPPRLPSRLRVAFDVRNPLLGLRGAAAVYGPQKGATPGQVMNLEQALHHWADLVGGDRDEMGAGAAGGIGFGLAALLGAKLEEAAPLILEMIGFPSRLSQADLVLTGEGSLDSQTLEGKAVLAVARAAREVGKPVVAVVGRSDLGAHEVIEGSSAWLDGLFSLESEFGQGATQRPVECLEQAAERVAARWARTRTGRDAG